MKQRMSENSPSLRPSDGKYLSSLKCDAGGGAYSWAPPCGIGADCRHSFRFRSVPCCINSHRTRRACCHWGDWVIKVALKSFVCVCTNSSLSLSIYIYIYVILIMAFIKSFLLENSPAIILSSLLIKSFLLSIMAVFSYHGL